MSVDSQKIKMRLRGYDCQVLDRAVLDIIETAQKTGAQICGPIPVPRELHKVTVLRGPHVHKKARDQFERRTYSRLLEVICTSQTLEALMEMSLASEVEVEIRV